MCTTYDGDHFETSLVYVQIEDVGDCVDGHLLPDNVMFPFLESLHYWIHLFIVGGIF